MSRNNEQTDRFEATDALHDAIDRIERDALRVEFMACAMTAFAQPVPGYEFEQYRLQPTGRED